MTWVHKHRTNHWRNMSTALAFVEALAADRRMYQMPTLERLAYRKQAAAYLQQCGCDRDLWPDQVREEFEAA